MSRKDAADVAREVMLRALDEHIEGLERILDINGEGLTASQHGRLRESIKRLGKLLDWRPAATEPTMVTLHPSHKWEKTPDPLLIGRAKSYGKVMTVDQLAQCQNCMIQSFEPGADSECACPEKNPW